MKKLLVMLLVLFSAQNVFASDRDEISMLNQAKISLVDAIQAAESNLNGKALEASIDDDAFTPTFEVKILKEGRVYKVRVDGKTKEVLGSREDRD